MRILLIGKGKMGQTFLNLFPNEVSSFIDVSSALSLEKDDFDFAVDFSHPNNLNQLLEFAHSHNIPLVIATTNHTKEQIELIKKCSVDIPICFDSNLSSSFIKIKKALRILLKQDLEKVIIEDIHHISKIDSPSGTSKALAEEIRKYNGNIDLSMISKRTGDVIGIHRVTLIGKNQKIELSFEIFNRSEFAINAYNAGILLQNKKNGLYNYEELCDE